MKEKEKEKGKGKGEKTSDTRRAVFCHIQIGRGNSRQFREIEDF
jgi:hypothetical protein